MNDLCMCYNLMMSVWCWRAQDDDTLLPAVNTLPVISEDEEEENEDDTVSPLPITPCKLPHIGEEEEGEGGEHSSTSPLLNKAPNRANFPNGDIIGSLR